jgi:hypothetical protein
MARFFNPEEAIFFDPATGRIGEAGEEGVDIESLIGRVNEPPVVIPGQIVELKGHRSYTTFKACNWFGDFVVTGSDDGSVFWYDPSDGSIVNVVVRQHRRNVNVVAVHKEKKLLATSGVDSFALLWEPGFISKVNRAQIKQRVSFKLAEEHDHTFDDACTVM